MFGKVETFSQVEVNHFGPASLITRNTNDVQQVQMVVFMGLTIMVSAPILIVGGIIMALRTDVPLSGPARRDHPADGRSSSAWSCRRAIPLFRATQTKIDRINQVMRETLAGVRVIRAFVRTRHEERRFGDASRDLYDTQLKVGPAVRPHPAGDLRDLQPLDRRGPLVRGDPGPGAASSRSAT